MGKATGVIIAIVIILLILFFPKPCGYISDKGFSNECKCIGTRTIQGPFPDSWGIFRENELVCYGIPTRTTCYEFEPEYIGEFDFDHTENKRLVSCNVPYMVEHVAKITKKTVGA